MAVQNMAYEAGPRLATRSLVAGIVAGALAALLSAGAQLLMGARVPDLNETAWSAFAAGAAGGVLYYALVKFVPRPIDALWAVSLAIATIDSLLIILLPLPAGHGPHLAIPIDGLVVPVRQMGALLGWGRLGTRHFPERYLAADTVLHYIPAAVVAAVIPSLVGKPRRSE
jgi:hypothetical protein